MKILLTLRMQEVAEVSDEKYDTELTKMAEGATEKGVNEVSAGVKNMDDEFTKDEHGVGKAAERRSNVGTSKKSGATNSDRNAKRNAARKSKKQARQNKKKGRR